MCKTCITTCKALKCDRIWNLGGEADITTTDTRALRSVREDIRYPWVGTT